MANSKPQNTNKSKNTKTNQVSVTSSADALDNGKDLDNVYSKNHTNKSLHKSFDFSNVALFAKENDFSSNPNDDANFRHFHQMRIYIQVPGIYQYGDYKALAKTETVLLTSNLPESMNYSLGSSWEAPLASTFSSASTNLIMQMAGNKLGLGASGVPRASTLRIWSGSKPLTLDLKIPVIDDGADGSSTNLMEALEILGALALPKTGGKNSSFYTPPPSPLNLNITYATDFSGGKDSISLNNGAVGRILVQLGGILLVDYCVIESFSVTYPSTKTMIMHDYTNIPDNKLNYGATSKRFLHPLLAEVSIKISTVEAITADTYAKMLWGRPQSGQGKLNFDASSGLLGVATATAVQGVQQTINMAKGLM